MTATHDESTKPFTLRLTSMLLVWGIIFFFGVPSTWPPVFRIGYILVMLVLLFGAAAWLVHLHGVTGRDARSRLTFAYLGSGYIGTWVGPALSDYVYGPQFDAQGLILVILCVLWILNAYMIPSARRS